MSPSTEKNSSIKCCKKEVKIKSSFFSRHFFYILALVRDVLGKKTACTFVLLFVAVFLSSLLLFKDCLFEGNSFSSIPQFDRFSHYYFYLYRKMDHHCPW